VILILKSPNAGLDALARGLPEARLVEVDVTDMRGVRAVVEAHRPDAVVSTVWRDARRAEADPEAAFRYDGEAAINLAAAALEFGASACWISVADVFGHGGGPFDEDAAPTPGSEHGDAARRAEVFFARAMRERGLVVRSGPWRETIAEELREGRTAPAGAWVQTVEAEALGRFIAGLLERGVTGTAHAVPAEPAQPAEAVYAAVARELGLPEPVAAPIEGHPPPPRLSSRLHPPLDPVAAAGPPSAEAEAEAEPGTPADSSEIARHAGTVLRRHVGAAGQVVAIDAGGGRSSLWLRTGKGVVERADADDELLGSGRTVTIEGASVVRFAPAADFELFVLVSPPGP